MYCEPAFWNGPQWVAPSSDIHFPTPWPVYRGNFSTNELCEMVDAVLAKHGQIPVHLNEAFNALNMESFESGITPHPVESPNWNHNDGLGLVDVNMAGRQVRTFNDALGLNSGTQGNIRDSGSENGFLPDWQGQTPLPTGVWSNAACNTTPEYEMIAGWMTDDSEQLEERRVMVAEPGSQAPGVTVSVALHPPHLKAPSQNPNGIASGSNAQEMSTENASQTTPKAPGSRRNRGAPRRAAKPTEFQCAECTLSKGRPVTFKGERSYQRHLTRTKKHNAPPILGCSCGAEVVRKDAMRSHRKTCNGTTVPLDAYAEGQGPMDQGMD